MMIHPIQGIKEREQGVHGGVEGGVREGIVEKPGRFLRAQRTSTTDMI